MLKPLTQHLAERLDDQQRFGGAVSMPGMGLSEAEPGPPPLVRMSTVAPNSSESDSSGSVRDVLLARLLAAKPEGTESVAQWEALLAQADELGPKIDAFIEARTKAERATLTSQYREIRGKGREQIALCQRLEHEFQSANAEWNGTEIERKKAINAVEAAKHQRSHLSRWASDSQIAAADERVEAAKAVAREAIKFAADAMSERNEAAEKFWEAKNELVRLGIEESRLRHAINGDPYVDAEYGLQVPA